MKNRDLVNSGRAREEKKPCLKRHIKSIYLRTGKPGDKVKIRGRRFGPEQGSVTFSPDVKAEVVKWTHTQIWAILAQIATSCRVSVSIHKHQDPRSIVKVGRFIIHGAAPGALSSYAIAPNLSNFPASKGEGGGPWFVPCERTRGKTTLSLVSPALSRMCTVRVSRVHSGT